MKQEEKYGTPVEKGIVKERNSDGYIVYSLSRPGIHSRRIKAVTGKTTIATGTIVYFCLFPDGDGVILG